MKHSKFLTIAVASVMAFSAFALASCDDDDDGDTPSGTTGTAVVTNEALTGKLISYYSFENGGAATDPMTGASVSDYDVTLSSEDTVSGKTGNGIQSGSTYVTLPLFYDAITLEGGVSFSFVSYSDVSITNDWNDLVTTDYMEITYGNLDGVVSAYPAICSELGVGAYAASAYAEAQDVLTTAQLASPTGNAYYGYNAGLVEGSDDGTYVGALFAEMVSTWQYFTITVTTEDVCFYRNGALAYRYGSEIIGNKGDYLLRDVIDLDEGMDTNLTKLFAGEGGIIDDLIVGSALTADEALALYNDLSGSSKTSADVTVKSNLNEDEANKATADAEVVAAVKAQRKETTATVRDDLLASVLNTGVDQVGTVGSGNDLSVNGWHDGTKYKSASDMYTPTLNDDGTFTVVLEYYQFSDQAANYHSASTILYNNSAEALALRQDAYGWDVNEAWYALTTIESDLDFDGTYLGDADGAKIVETITYDGTDLVINYLITPIDAGATYEEEETITLSDGSTYTTSASINVPETCSVTYTISGVTLTNFTFHLALESAYCEIMSVTGATASAY